MKIGYCVEGSTDRALLQGLKSRWCPDAELVEGKFRGEFRRREIGKACLELHYKGVDLIVLLRDSNDEDWRAVRKVDQQACSTDHQHLTVFAVCDRNVECWLTCDARYAAQRTSTPANAFAVADPKGVFEAALGITSLDRKEPELADFTHDAPLQNWLHNKSFEAFYDDLRQKSKELGCTIENLRDRAG